MKSLYFDIGPVQPFILQSRRTRDLWGSSYLLSFLAGHAMYGAQRRGGSILRPSVDQDEMFAWISQSKHGQAPTLGSLPDCFVVEVPEDCAPKDIAQAAQSAFFQAWQKVADEVWRHFVARAAPTGYQTRTIWERQIAGFWKISWAVGEEDESALAWRRDVWSTQWLPEEPGDKCTVMPDFQEISGYFRANERDKQNEFWKAIQASGIGPFDMRLDERLCAIALVKRFYPKIAQETLGGKLDVTKWPSTVDVAAVPWVRNVLTYARKEAKTYTQGLQAALQDGKAETILQTGGVSSLVDGNGDPSVMPFLRLDANWFQQSYLKRGGGYAKGNLSNRLLNDPAEIKVLTEKLAAINNQSGEQGMLGAAASYYALLLGDGDQLGMLIQRLGSTSVSQALATFTQRVPSVVEKYDGKVVYAGGDDILAILPLPGALGCARAIRQAYYDAFVASEMGNLVADSRVTRATISIGVVFAHIRTPLALVLHEAHRLLDDVAKEQNQRDSCAASVFRQSGSSVQWVTTWQRPQASEGPSPGPHSKLCAIELLERFQAYAARDRTISGGLLQAIRQLIISLGDGNPRITPGVSIPLAASFTHDHLAKLIKAEVEHRYQEEGRSSGEGSLATTRAKEVTALTACICALLPQVRNNVVEERMEYGIDGLMLAEFLSHGGDEGDHFS